MIRMLHSEMDRIQFYRTFLITLGVIGFAVAGTIWVLLGWFESALYLGGFATPLLFAWYAPSYGGNSNQPGSGDQDNRGFA